MRNTVSILLTALFFAFGCDDTDDPPTEIDMCVLGDTGLACPDQPDDAASIDASTADATVDGAPPDAAIVDAGPDVLDELCDGICDRNLECEPGVPRDTCMSNCIGAYAQVDCMPSGDRIDDCHAALRAASCDAINRAPVPACAQMTVCR